MLKYSREFRSSIPSLNIPQPHKAKWKKKKGTMMRILITRPVKKLVHSEETKKKILHQNPLNYFLFFSCSVTYLEIQACPIQNFKARRIWLPLSPTFQCLFPPLAAFILPFNYSSLLHYYPNHASSPSGSILLKSPLSSFAYPKL